MIIYHASWAESRERMSSDQTDAYRAELAGQGREPKCRNFEMRIVQATPDLAERLEVGEESSRSGRRWNVVVEPELVRRVVPLLQ